MTTTNDPTAAAAELRKQAQLKREVAARTLDRCRNLSLPADLRGAEESDARDDLRTAGEYDRLASVLEAAAAREAALNARIASLERLEWAVRKVVETFREDEAQGYRSRERRYAIDMLGRYLPPLPETSHKGEGDV